MSRYNPATKPEFSNGILAIKPNSGFAWMNITLIGGPFDNRPTVEGVDFGVCVRAERVPNTGVDVHVAIADFDVPTQSPSAIEAAVLRTVTAAMAGKTVFVGCMGGWGRTGLFLALVAKAMGEADPVAFVREKYTPHAVETHEQQDYVKNFDVTDLKRRIKRVAWEYRIAGFLPESLRKHVISL